MKLITHNSKLKTNAGQMLIESMVGISIIVVGLLGIMGLLSRSISLNRTINNRFIANYLASEGIEITKNIIDTNIVNGKSWNDGLTTNADFEADYTSLILNPYTGSQLKFDQSSNLYSYQTGSPTPFTRIIHIQPIGSDEIKVISTVTWIDRGGVRFTVDMEDHFFNWRE